MSLFSGAGGLDLGAAAAGCYPAVCVDIDADCIETLRRNAEFAGTALLQEDVITLRSEQILGASGLRKGEVPLLIGGPPCQSFSKAAYWTSTGEEARSRRQRAGYEQPGKPAVRSKGRTWNPLRDPRTRLVGEYLRILLEIRPEAFVFENVLSMTHPKSKPVLDAFVANCQNGGYSVRIFKANAAAYGVPQIRQRVFVIGLRGKIPPEVPRPTHALPHEPRRSRLRRPVRVGTVIAPYAGQSYAEPDEVVTGRWATHLTEIPPGQNYKALSAWAGHPNPSFLAETRFWNFLLKLHPDLPSWTIAANPGPWVGPFHWESRRLRTPELAAIQTFPHGYTFAGTKRSVRRQIGNAVPPALAYHAVASVLQAVLGQDLHTADVGPWHTQ